MILNKIKLLIVISVATLFFVVIGCDKTTSLNNSQIVATILKDTLFTSWTDSLEYIVKIGSNEEKLEALSDLTMYYQERDIFKAKIFAWHQKELSSKLNDDYWLGDAFENLGCIYFYEQNIDSTQFYFQSAYNIWNKTDMKKKIGSALSNLSLVQRLKSQPDSALFYLQKSLDIFEELKEDASVAQILANIASVYNDFGNNLKHDEYALKALSIQEQIDDKQSLGITLINLCLSMQSQNRYSEAVEYGERALKVFREINHPLFICVALIRTGNVLLEINENEQASKYLTEAIQVADNIGNYQMKIEALRFRGNFYLAKGEYNKAKSDAEIALNLTDTINKKELVFIYDLLVTSSVYTNEKEDVLKYLKKYINTKDDIQQKNWVEKISDLEIKYETEKKEIKISALEQEKQFMKWLSVAGGTVLFLLLSTFLFLWRWAMQKRKFAEQQKVFAEQKVKQLEQEKQLVATQSVLDGETKERTRLARDLHDGLGSMLTGVKLHMQEIKKGAKLENTDIERYNKALGLLDKSVNEMRRVAHHLMPDSLSRFGLKNAINDFCSELPSVTFNYYGDDARIDTKMEVMIYSVIHELTNNALKHSGAEKIMIQIIRDTDRISFNVQDDGCGFDISAKSDGMGLQNIRTRVAAYNGILNIDSKIDVGTEVNGELKV